MDLLQTNSSDYGFSGVENQFT